MKIDVKGMHRQHGLSWDDVRTEEYRGKLLMFYSDEAMLTAEGLITTVMKTNDDRYAVVFLETDWVNLQNQEQKGYFILLNKATISVNLG